MQFNSTEAVVLTSFISIDTAKFPTKQPTYANEQKKTEQNMQIRTPRPRSGMLISNQKV